MHLNHLHVNHINSHHCIHKSKPTFAMSASQITVKFFCCCCFVFYCSTNKKCEKSLVNLSDLHKLQCCTHECLMVHPSRRWKFTSNQTTSRNRLNVSWKSKESSQKLQVRTMGWCKDSRRWVVLLYKHTYCDHNTGQPTKSILHYAHSLLQHPTSSKSESQA